MSAVVGGPTDPGSRVATTIAFCPSPPLLHPAVEGRAEAATEALRRACSAAVTAMLAARPEVVAVVADGAEPGLRFGPGDAGSLRGLGVDLTVPFAGRVRPGGRRVPLPHALGAWLLDEAGFSGLRVGVGPADLGPLLADLPGPVGVLAMGDGSARRSTTAPGHLDEAAAPFDAAVSRALAQGDAAALAALDPCTGARLLAAGVPVWRAVGAAAQGRVTATLHHDEAPFGVGYLVADWVVA